MLGLAKRNIEKTYLENNKQIDNVYLTRYDIERILNILDKKDNVERIYINFCNPWPRGKHHKKRLTHSRQLEKYKQILTDDGKIYFKTDDDGLFKDSLVYFNECGFEIEKQTYDLENEENFWDNIETEHEKMFTEQGIKIKALIAKNINKKI
jgi:tRNA (guanine-N7-)-methyltransferase